MEAKSIAKFQRLSSRRIGVVLDQIRGTTVKKALDVLPFIEMRTSELVYKAIHSAAANLEVKAGKKLDSSKIYIKEIFDESSFFPALTSKLAAAECMVL